MNAESALSFIITYKYVALFPLAFFEGPIVALLVGFLISLGYLEFLPSFIVMIFGDLIPDTIYYYFGRFGNRNNLIEKYGSGSGFLLKNFKLMERLWTDHGKKTMFLSKLAYGLSIPFLISAGLVKMPYKRFAKLAIPVTLFQYGAIMLIGFYAGHSYRLASAYIEYTGMIIAGILVFFVGGYILIARYARQQIAAIEREEETLIQKENTS